MAGNFVKNGKNGGKNSNQSLKTIKSVELLKRPNSEKSLIKKRNS